MGIFDIVAADDFSFYHCELKWRDRLMGGIPKDPKAIEGWLRKNKYQLEDISSLRQDLLETAVQLGIVNPERMDDADIEASIAEIAGEKHTVGFKRDEHGLYVEDRIVKAMLRETVNIRYAGERWGKDEQGISKGPKSYFVERVFIKPARIYLGRQEPDGIELFVGHPTGPQGKQANLTYYEYCDRATIAFDVMVLKSGKGQDSIKPELWPHIWVQGQEIGLGAVRSQSYGRFDVEAWEAVKFGHCADRQRQAQDTRRSLAAVS